MGAYSYMAKSSSHSSKAIIDSVGADLAESIDLLN